MSYYFIERAFPSPSEMVLYQEIDRNLNLFRKIRRVINQCHIFFKKNPFDINNREVVHELARQWHQDLSSLPITAGDIEKIYWGFLCPKITRKSFDANMKQRVIKVWEKYRTVEEISKNLHDLNNCKRFAVRFYERKNMYTPPHVIQSFLENEGLEIWSQKDVEELISAVLAYNDQNPNGLYRKGFLSLEDFYHIAQFPILQGCAKTPEQMMEQWNQRSSIWLIGQDIRKEDEELLANLYLAVNSAEELSEAFAAQKNGLYYPDRAIQNFYDSLVHSENEDFRLFFL